MEITKMLMPTPWMAFYPDRFTKQTDQLRPIEHSAYYRLFESYAQAGHLLNDPYMLRSIVRLDSELTVIEGMTGTKPDYGTWIDFTDSIVKSLLARFFTLESDGTYQHAGWEKELTRARVSYDARVRGANAVNAKKAAERSAEQHTTYNEQRTTIQPIIDSFTSETGQPTTETFTPEIGHPIADSPRPALDSENEDLTADTGRPTDASSTLSGSTIPAQTTGQRVQERSATGPATGAGQTAATSSARLPSGRPVAQTVGESKRAENSRKVPEDWEERPWLYMTSEEYEEMRRQQAAA